MTNDLVVFFPIKVYNLQAHEYAFHWATAELLDILDKNTDLYAYEIQTGETYD